MTNRIGLDTRMLNNTGIGTYLRGLLGGFQETGLDQKLGLTLYGPKRVEAWPHESFQSPIYSIQEQWQYSKRLAACRLWHAPHYNVPIQKGKTKLVVTIHDIIHWIFRKQFLSPLQTVYAGWMLKRAIMIADRIIAVSHHTKQDLVTHFQADEKKIVVIHEGVSSHFRRLSPDALKAARDKLKAAYGIPENFFLYVGMMKPHKNVQTLIRVFRRLKAEGKIKAALVLIGRKDKKYPPGFDELTSLASTPDIIHLPTIDHEDLCAFYNLAIALIHPSLYEGFGLTLLEAMRCETPVIASDAASIPEVVGDAAKLVDVRKESALADAITEMELNPSLRLFLKQKGYDRSQRFSWSETARRTAMVYESVLEEA